MELVKKRHPRRAVWLSRATELLVPAGFAVLAVAAMLRGSAGEASAWLVGSVACLIYAWRLRYVWTWAWRTGSEDALERVAALVDIQAPGTAERLRQAYIAEVPTWRHTQDRMAQIDSKATLRAILEQLDRAGVSEESGQQRGGGNETG